MIVRGYIECSTCHHPHMPRVQVGIDPSQPHTFNCLACNEPIKLKLKINEKTISARIIPIENCVLIAETECTPVYLCADFVADASEINNGFSFPSGRFIQEAIKNQAVHKIDLTPRQQNLSTPLQTWNSLKKIWRLENSDKKVIADRLINEFCSAEGVPEKDFSNLLWFFLNSLFRMNEKLREEVKLIIKINQTEFMKFLIYYKLELKPLHRKSQFDLMSDYFDAYDQHSQVFAYVRMNTEINKLGKATSIDFEKTKSFYANSYEFYAGAISVYTCLNNIKEGRPFDQLNNISLKKYLLTDKAKRRDSLKSNPLFFDITSEFDSTIRNASFHNWFFLLPDNQTIELRSGGTGSVQKITYTEYLFRCGVLFKQFCQLFTLELELEQLSKDFGAYTFSVLE